MNIFWKTIFTFNIRLSIVSLLTKVSVLTSRVHWISTLCKLWSTLGKNNVKCFEITKPIAVCEFPNHVNKDMFICPVKHLKKRKDWQSDGFIFLSDTYACTILGPLVPLFRVSGDVSSGFQSREGFCLIRIAEANVMYISCDPPLVLHVANFLMDSIAGGGGGWFISCPRQQWVSNPRSTESDGFILLRCEDVIV